MAELTYAQLARDYAKALTVIDAVRRERDALLTVLEAVSLQRGIDGLLCWCVGSDRSMHSTACLLARAAIAKAEGR